MRSLLTCSRIALSLTALTLGFGATASAQLPETDTGPIHHQITGFTQRLAIPADWTIEQFANIATDTPAPEGHIWYILQGNATNNGDEARSIDGNTYTIHDAAGTEYRIVPQSKYTPEGMAPSYIDLPPGATAEWFAFFSIPLDAEGLRLQVTDLQLVPDEVKQVRMPGPKPPAAAPAAAAAESAAPSIVGTWALDEARSSAAADGNTAGLMATLEIKADGTFEALYGTHGTYTFEGGELVAIYSNSPGLEKKGGSLDGEHLRFPAPAGLGKYCYLTRVE